MIGGNDMAEAGKWVWSSCGDSILDGGMMKTIIADLFNQEGPLFQQETATPTGPLGRKRLKVDTAWSPSMGCGTSMQ